MLYFKSFLRIFFILGFLFETYGQASPRFRHIGVEDGLAQSSVTSIFKDSYGFMWFGTRDGLNRYDSYNLEQFKFDNRDSTTLSNNTISSLAEDKFGNIWIGTNGGGINRYNQSTGKFDRLVHEPENQNSLSDSYIYNIAKDSNGLLWVGTNSGFSSIDPVSLSVVNYKPVNRFGDQYDVRVNYLHIDSDGTFYLATEGQGLIVYEPKRDKYIQYKTNSEDPSSIGSNILNNIYDDRAGHLWVGTWGFGLIRFHKESKQFKLFKENPNDPKGLPNNNIFSIVNDSYGHLWLGTRNGLSKLDPQKEIFTNYHNVVGNSYSLVDNVVYSLAYDHENEILWVGTWGNGLNILDKYSRNVIHFQNNPSDEKSLSHNDVFGLLEDSLGNLWIATEGGGLNYFDKQNGSFTSFLHDPNSKFSLSSNDIYALEFDRRGKLWIGTSNGLDYYDSVEKRFHQYSLSADQLKNQTIIDLYADSKGFLWISWALEGVTRLNLETGELKEFWGQNSSEFNDVTCMIEDYQGQMWFGSKSTGLCKLNMANEQITYFREESGNAVSFASDYIYDLYQDTKGRIWIGTRGAGLSLIMLQEDGTYNFKPFTIDDGLSDNWVYGINEDSNGNIWVTCSEGISKMSANTQEIHSLNFISANQGAFHKGKTSGLFYLGSEGIDFFSPDKLQIETSTSSMVINKLKKYNQDVQSGLATEVPGLYTAENIELSYNDKLIEIDFININYNAYENRSYAYRMENFNDDWIRIGERRNIAFTGLPPGNYLFRVKPVLRSGELGTESASIALDIPPPWWLNSVAKSIYVLLLLAMLFGFIHLRTKALKERQRQLELIVEERTTQLKLLNKEATEQRERSEELLLNILPRDVAEELKSAGFTSPVHYEDISVIFADFKEFTNIVASIPGKKLVEELDDIFQCFDDIMEEEGVEKIQTIGDAYLAAAGLPKKTEDHAQRCVKAAIRMIDYLHTRNLKNSVKWKIRVGIHSGPVMAGVVGKKKFSYDIFGDTVNIAARIQTESEEGRINVSAYTHGLIRDFYEFTYRGKIEAKGKGDLDMYFIEGVNLQSSAKLKT